MNLSLISCPVEIKAHVEAFLTFEDVLNLSSTCKLYRLLLIPRIFRKVTIRNTATSATAVQEIGNGLLAQHVKVLKFIGNIPDGGGLIPEGEDEDQASDEGNDNESPLARSDEALINGRTILHPDVRAILARPTVVFPNVHSLSIRFDFSESDELGGECDYWMYLWRIDYADEDDLIPKDWRWRALLRETFQTICSTQASLESPLSSPCSFITDLEIQDLIAYEVPAFTSSDFHSFLGQLRTFRLTLRGDGNGDGMEVGTMPEYGRVMRQLDRFFFDHLDRVEHLYLRADPGGILGPNLLAEDEDNDSPPLQLHPSQMPSLRELTADTVVIGSYLTEFIAAHAETLEKVHLRRCFAGGVAVQAETSSASSIDERATMTEWAALFNGIRAAKMAKLRSVELWPKFEHHLPSAEDEHNDQQKGNACDLLAETVAAEFDSVTGDSNENEMVEVKRIGLSASGGAIRRVFAYGHAMMKMSVCINEPLTIAAFMLGEDDKAWNLLQNALLN